MTTDRRRSPRLQIFGKLHGQLVALDVPVSVTEMSLGGLSFETSIEFPPGVVHEFQLTLGDSATVAVRGRIMHCRRISASGAPPRFIVGAQFVDEADAEAYPVSDLVDRLR